MTALGDGSVRTNLAAVEINWKKRYQQELNEPSVETEITSTPQVPCSAVSGEVCISYENTIDLSAFSILLSSMT